MVIRLTVPSIEEDDLQAVREVLQTGFLVQGQHVAAFEKVIADYVGTKHAVAVSNCTTALHLSLMAFGVQAGDMVVVTTYSWPATANVIELCGAQPVFVDINPDTFNMDVEQLENTLNRLMKTPETARRVKAIIPVHTFGQAANMPEIIKLAESYNLPIVEDAACALGTKINGNQAGSIGRMGCFSFHPRKAITTGEGGMITTDDDALADKVRALRNHGIDPNSENIDFVMPGNNYRLTEFQAAFGVTQLAKVDRVIVARQERAKYYDELLADTPFQTPVVPEGHKPVYQSYVILVPKEITERRQDIIKFLVNNDIQTTIGTYHMPMTTYFKTRYGYQVGDFPATDDVFARSITLPLHEYLTKGEQQTVVSTLCKALES